MKQSWQYWAITALVAAVAVLATLLFQAAVLHTTGLRSSERGGHPTMWWGVLGPTRESRFALVPDRQQAADHHGL